MTRLPVEVQAHLLRSLLPDQVSRHSQRILIDCNDFTRFENVQGLPCHVAARTTHKLRNGQASTHLHTRWQIYQCMIRFT